MIVRNLTAWAGTDFSFRRGDLVEIREATGLARIEAELADMPDDIDQPAADYDGEPRLWTSADEAGDEPGDAPRKRGRPRKVQQPPADQGGENGGEA